MGVQKAIRKMPVKTAEVVCNIEGYEGWTVKIRTNAPFTVYEKFMELNTGDIKFSEIWGPVSQIVSDWNFVDEEGEPLPIPKNDPSVLPTLPTDLLMWLLNDGIRANVTEGFTKGAESETAGVKDT